MSGRDWQAWHQPYADETSALSRRLREVQRHIVAWLEQCPHEALSAVSVCAGQGHDLLGVLAARSDRDRVRATLLEYDPRNVAAAQRPAYRAGLSNVTVLLADAAVYAKAVPADLVLMAGVFGNISDADVRRTIGALPQLCADGATVIWTRTRRAPDLTLTGQAWSPWAAGVLSGGPRRRTDGEDPAQRVPVVKGAPCFGPQGLQGRVTGVRRCDRLLPQRSLGLPPVGPVLHLDVHEPGRRQVPAQIHSAKTRGNLQVCRVGDFPGAQDQSATGSQ